MKGNLLKESDKTDLVIVFRDADLKKHYVSARKTYIKWAEDVGNMQIALIGGATHQLSLSETFEQLQLYIREFDSKLRMLMSRRNTQEAVGKSHSQLCGLFAMYILAGEPILPK
jgi:hypothetical protein